MLTLALPGTGVTSDPYLADGFGCIQSGEKSNNSPRLSQKWHCSLNKNERYLRAYSYEVDAAIHSALRLLSDAPLHHSHCLGLLLRWDPSNPDPTLMLRARGADIMTFEQLEHVFTPGVGHGQGRLYRSPALSKLSERKLQGRSSITQTKLARKNYATRSTPLSSFSALSTKTMTTNCHAE